jgi:hypothetical protein
MPVFDAFLIWKKVAHSIRRTFVGKRKLHVQNYNWAIDALPKRLPKTIWLYWDKPLDQAPSVVQASVASWIRHNPGWDVRLLSDENLAEFVKLPQAHGVRKIQWKADLIRVALLRDHGGVWADATSFCQMPLDNWLPPLMQSGFFAFPDTYPGRLMQNWFLAALPGNYLVTRWAEKMERYYGKRGKLLHYFWVMYMFEYVVRTDREAARIWDFTPKISMKGALLLKRIMTQKDLAERIPETVDLSAIPVLKISSGAKTDDPEWMDVLGARRDIDLARMVDNVIYSADHQGTGRRTDRV